MSFKLQFLVCSSLAGVLTLTACGTGVPEQNEQPTLGSASPLTSVDTSASLIVVEEDQLLRPVVLPSDTVAEAGDTLQTNSNSDSQANESDTPLPEEILSAAAPNITPAKVQAAQSSESGTSAEKPDIATTADNPSEKSTSSSQTSTEDFDHNKYITIGKNPGDAHCMVLGDRNVEIGSAQLSDWKRWVVGDPRYFIGREFLGVEDDPKYGKVLRQKFVPNFKGTEWVAMGNNIEGHRTYRVVQSIMFEDGWDWGGDWPYQGGKFGFGFGSGTYPTGGQSDPKGFTTRLIWRGNRDGLGGRIAVYSYASDRPGKYGEDIDIGDVSIGEWHEVVMEVTANSSTQKSDGSLRVWLNGELRVERYNIGWQLAGDQPLIDRLSYMSFYGGHGTVWSPDGNTHMRFSDVCWAPVVNGYSGIDPEAGITKIDPNERNVKIFDDDLGSSEIDELQKEKSSILGRLGSMILQLNLLSISGSPDYSNSLLLASSELNGLADVVRGQNVELIQSDSINRLNIAYDHLEMAKHFSDESNANDLNVLGSFQHELFQITVDIAEFGILISERESASENCNDSNFRSECAQINQHIADAKAHKVQLLDDFNNQSSEIFDSAAQVWFASQSVFRTLE